jgi:hypothetical protein
MHDEMQTTEKTTSSGEATVSVNTSILVGTILLPKIKRTIFFEKIVLFRSVFKNCAQNVQIGCSIETLMDVVDLVSAALASKQVVYPPNYSVSKRKLLCPISCLHLHYFPP